MLFTHKLLTCECECLPHNASHLVSTLVSTLMGVVLYTKINESSLTRCRLFSDLGLFIQIPLSRSILYLPRRWWNHSFLREPTTLPSDIIVELNCVYPDVLLGMSNHVNHATKEKESHVTLWTIRRNSSFNTYFQ